MLPYGRPMTLLAVIGTLLGALIGAVAVVASQRIAARDTAKRESIQRQAAMKAALENRVVSFIRSAQEVERVAAEGDKHDSAAKNLVHRDLWIDHKVLRLTCSDDLRAPLDELANLLTDLLWHGTPDGTPVYEHIRLTDGRFREAARREIQWVEEQYALPLETDST